MAQSEAKYRLAELGHDVYNLLGKTTTYAMSTSAISSLRREIPVITIASAILWAAAIFSVVDLKEDFTR
jgi:hypothetical protein